GQPVGGAQRTAVAGQSAESLNGRGSVLRLNNCIRPLSDSHPTVMALGLLSMALCGGNQDRSPSTRS
ncbi:MAG TPA: hypothetical protein PKA11_09550, partial [Accumulibacter sp.]|nr:hypothetical protein [Accumulibacter sp.]